MNKKLNLGIIGASEGNGHPYSWSAIFNGYNPEIMNNCGFPSIPIYLSKQKFPDDQLSEAQVTHIWTQDINLSRHVAAATYIKNVSENCYDFIEHVDGILLARDDAEKHLEMARPFLKAGLPIYIDKPMALSVSDAKKMFNLQQYEGQIFSCSAMKYAPEFKLTRSQIEMIGKVRLIHGYIPKSWNKYSVHIIDPILKIIPDRGQIINHKVLRSNDRVLLMINFKNGEEIYIQTCGAAVAPTSIRIIGTNGWVDFLFQDTFRAFRLALSDFVQGIINKDVRTSSNDILNVIKLVELGRS
tara:strand:+ start:2924 stop:3820 length:897 start_codon:yes stop_codon:yes gene_type:complete